jgi:transposase InsO family protein
MLAWIPLSTGKYYQWQKRRHQDNKHNGHIPKSHWLLPWERQAIINYRYQHLNEGYRRLCYMMLDDNIVAVSASTVYRILKSKGLLLTQWRHQKAKGSGFAQPSAPHKHWHLDISYINFKGTFVYLVCLIDGYSRYIVHHELRTSVESLDIEIMLERARQKFPWAKPALITDNGPQFIAKELKLYLQHVGITHRKTRFFYPQSNGKIERFYQTCKNELIRKNSFLSLDDLKKQIDHYITVYNTQRLHSSIGYITPFDMLSGRQEIIFKERNEKLYNAQQARREHYEKLAA